MENKTIAICQVCKNTFEYDMKPGYPRKYCPICSAQKKAEFEASKGVPAKEMLKAIREIPSDRERSIVAQCLTKIVYSGVDITPEAVLETYRLFLQEL